MGTGVSPATDFLKSSGFNLEKDGGIATDEYMRVKGYKNVFAIGDIAHYPQHPEGQQRRVEHWNCAGNQVCDSSNDCVPLAYSVFRDGRLRTTSPARMIWLLLQRSQSSGHPSAKDYDTLAQAQALTTPTLTGTLTN